MLDILPPDLVKNENAPRALPEGECSEALVPEFLTAISLKKARIALNICQAPCRHFGSRAIFAVAAFLSSDAARSDATGVLPADSPLERCRETASVYMLVDREIGSSLR